MESLGRPVAIAGFRGPRFNGFAAWLAWRIFHISQIQATRNRLGVLLDWSFAYAYRRNTSLLEEQPVWEARMADVRYERTLIFLKPDGVQRGLVGEVLRRFERAGLKIAGLKMVHAQPSFLERHYPSDEGFMRTIGGKTREAFEAAGLDVKGQTGSDDPLEIGRAVRGWLIDYVSSGPVVAAVLEGIQAVATVRKLVGDTLPVRAAPGSIRGDFSVDSPTVANLQRRPVRNLIHASGTLEEAAFEIGLWFRPEELFEYRRVDEVLIQGE